MTEDPHPLIEEARTTHAESDLWDGWCRVCLSELPCPTLQLAEALEQALSVTLDASVNRILFDLTQERDAAQARADRLAGWVKNQNHRYTECLYGPCACGLDAALGLAAGDEKQGHQQAACLSGPCVCGLATMLAPAASIVKGSATSVAEERVTYLTCHSCLQPIAMRSGDDAVIEYGEGVDREGRQSPLCWAYHPQCPPLLQYRPRANAVGLAKDGLP